MCFLLKYWKVSWTLFLVLIVLSLVNSNPYPNPCTNPQDCPEQNCPPRCERCTRIETNCLTAMLTQVPKQVLLNSTVFFNLKDNYIEKLDDDTFYGSNPQSLVKLDLSKNRIRTISKHALKPLKKLEMLHLDDNLLVEILPYMLQHQPHIEFLSLAYNHGLSLLDDGKPALYSWMLKTLEIHHCNITKLTPNIFDGVPKLEKLDLSYNRIVEFEPETFRTLTQLKILVLEGNPLDCGYVADTLEKLCARNVCVTFTCSHKPHGPIRTCKELPDLTTPTPFPTSTTEKNPDSPNTCIEIHPVFLWMIVILLTSILLMVLYWTTCKKFNIHQHPHQHQHHHRHHEHHNGIHNRPIVCPEPEIQPSNNNIVPCENTNQEGLPKAIAISETKSPQPGQSQIRKGLSTSL